MAKAKTAATASPEQAAEACAALREESKALAVLTAQAADPAQGRASPEGRVLLLEMAQERAAKASQALESALAAARGAVAASAQASEDAAQAEDQAQA